MSEIINAIIIDDEEIFITALKALLKKYFPQVNIIGKASNVKDAISLINMTEPNLLFLDISLPDGTAFDILDAVEKRDCEIIFTTASSEYAFRAFEFAALHYLMKPMTAEKLQDAMERYFTLKNRDFYEEKINILKENLNQNGGSEKILLSSAEGMSLHNISDIVRCESDDNYTRVYFTKKEKLLITKSLLNFTKLLKNFGFVRIHNQHLVNLKYLQKYLTGKSPVVIMSDGTELPVSKTYKTEFSLELKRYAKTV